MGELHLAKQAALRVLAICRQAERSVDAVLHRSQSLWTALTEYYDADRRKLVKAAIVDLDCQGLGNGKMSEGWTAEKAPSRLRLAVDFVVNKWRRTFTLSANERDLIARSLSRLLSLIECIQQPAHEDLVQLRLQLTAAVGLLEQRLWGVRELRK